MAVDNDLEIPFEQSPERRFMSLYVGEKQRVYRPPEVNDFEGHLAITEYIRRISLEENALLAQVERERFVG